MVKKDSLFKQWFYRNKQWLYESGRPNGLAKILNRFWAVVGARSRLFAGLVTLEVPGRKSGRVISFPLVMVTLDGQRYLASMLGNQAQWVRNVQAAHGKACLRNGGHREDVYLEEVAIEQRAPVLKTYLHAAPGARPHIPVDQDAPLSAFEAIAAAYPVFRVTAHRNP
ncbi:MAG: nitroreductase/quinone reductase family protein [Chloroflexota bacterium]